MAPQFWDQVQKMAEEAPEAGFPQVNFGQLTAVPVVIRWSSNTSEDGTVVRSPERRALKDGETLAEGEGLEIQFKVEISELNPQLEFDYERSVPVRKSGRVKTDWAEIVLPSLEKVFGKDWGRAIIGKHPYVLVEDVTNIAGKSSKSGKLLGVPKFLAVYKNREECKTARDARFTKPVTAVAVPEEESATAVQMPTPDEKIIKQVKSLVGSVGATAAKKMLEGHPFGEFDPDYLLEQAKD